MNRLKIYIIAIILQTSLCAQQQLSQYLMYELEKIDNSLKQVEEEIEKGAAREWAAKISLRRAQRTYDGVKNNYGDKFDESHPQILDRKERLAKLKEKLAKGLPVKKLSRWLMYELEKIDQKIKAVEREVKKGPSRTWSAKSYFKSAQRKYDDTKRAYKSEFNESHPQIAARKQQLQDFRDKLEGKSSTKKLSKALEYELENIDNNIKEMEKEVTKGDRAWAAKIILKDVEEAYNEAKKDYGNEFDENHSKIAAIKEKLEKGIPAKKLSRWLIHKLEMVDIKITAAEKNSTAPYAESYFKSALRIYNDVKKAYKDEFDESHPQIASLKKRLDMLKAKLDAKAKAAIEAKQPETVLVQPEKKLSRWVGYELEKIKGKIVNAEKNIHGPYAQSNVKSAQRVYDDAKKNYKKDFDESHPQIATLKKRLENLHTKLDAKAKAVVEAKQPETTPTQPQKKLSQWLGYKLDKVELKVASAEKNVAGIYGESSYKSALRSYNEAKRDYPKDFDESHLRIASLKQRLEALKTKLDVKAKAAIETKQPETVLVQPEKKLSRWVGYELEKIKGKIVNAEKNIHGPYAQSNVKSAQRVYDDAKKNYKKDFDESHPQIATLKKRLENLQARLKSKSTDTISTENVSKAEILGAATQLKTHLSYARAYKKECLYFKGTITGRVIRLLDFDGPWRALGQLNDQLHQGKKYVTIIATDSGEYQDMLTMHRELSQFSLSFDKFLRISMRKNWHKSIPHSFKLAGFKKRLRHFYNDAESSTRYIRNLRGAENTVPGIESRFNAIENELTRLIEFGKESRKSIENIEKNNSQTKPSEQELALAMNIDEHPRIIEARKKVSVARKKLKQIVHNAIVLGISKDVEKILKDARRYLKSGRKNNSSYDLEYAIKHYDKALAFLDKHKEKPGATAMRDKVIAERTSPEVAGVLNQLADEKKRAAQAEKFIKGFRDKKYQFEVAYNNNMSPQVIIKRFVEAQKALVLCREFQDVKEVKKNYPQWQNWLRSYEGHIAKFKRKLEFQQQAKNIKIKRSDSLQINDMVEARYASGQKPFLSEVLGFYGNLIHLQSRVPDYKRDYWTTLNTISGNCQWSPEKIDSADENLLPAKVGDIREILHPNGWSYVGKIDKIYGKMSLVNAGAKNWSSVWTPPEKIIHSWLPQHSIKILHGQTSKHIATLDTKGVLTDATGGILARFNSSNRQITDAFGGVLCEILENGTAKNAIHGNIFCYMEKDGNGALLQDTYGGNIVLIDTKKKEIETAYGGRVAFLEGYSTGSIRIIAGFYMTVLRNKLPK